LRACFVGLGVLVLGLTVGIGLDLMKTRSFAAPSDAPEAGAETPVALETEAPERVDVAAVLRESQVYLDEVRRTAAGQASGPVVTPTPLPSPTPSFRQVLALVSPGETPPTLRRVDVGTKLVALTFDDGPSPVNTRLLMDMLESRKASATFFFIGRQVIQYPEIAREAGRRGFALGNHTQNHKDLHQTKFEGAQKEIEECQKAFAAAGIEPPVLVRFPYGNSTPSLRRYCQTTGLATIAWNVDTRDWEDSTTADGIVENVMTNVGSGSIILMHERPEVTLEALPRVLNYLNREGYRLVTVEELLRESAAASIQ